MPDDIYGEEIAVAMTFQPDQEVTERDLKKWARGRVSAHKVPGKVSTSRCQDQVDRLTNLLVLLPRIDTEDCNRQAATPYRRFNNAAARLSFMNRAVGTLKFLQSLGRHNAAKAVSVLAAF